MGRDRGTVKARLLFWAYQCLVFLALPVFALIHLKQGAPAKRIAERFGRSPKPQSTKDTIWFHAASLGEIKQAEAFARALHIDHGYDILVTTFTHYGAQWVSQAMPFATHQYVPADLYAFQKKLVKDIEPKLAIVLEGDIWPAMLKALRDSGVPAILLNIRPSKSRKKYRKLYGYLLRFFSKISAATPELIEELTSLRLPKDDLILSRNLKAVSSSTGIVRSIDITGFIQDRPVWIAASTHASDEPHVVATAQKMAESHPETVAIWAPRHMERVPPIRDLLASNRLSYTLRSQTIDRKAQVLILDTIGELEGIFDGAFAVYLGGGMANEGGHNPLEPARFGVPILSGPHVGNHEQAFQTLQASNLVSYVENSTELTAALEKGLAGDLPTGPKELEKTDITQDAAFKAVLELLDD